MLAEQVQLGLVDRVLSAGSSGAVKVVDEEDLCWDYLL